MLGVIGAVVGGYALYAGSAYALRNRFIFPLDGIDFRRWHLWPHREGSTIEFETEAGIGFAHHLPAKGGEPKGRVILLHGNAMIAVDFAALAAKWSDYGFDVLVPEFRGYGGMDGKPSPENIVADTLKVLDMLPVIDGPLLIHGISLGGGLGMQLSRKIKIDAVVLQSTFSSIGDAAWKFGLPGILVDGVMDSRQAMKEFGGRVLIIHGDKDRLFGQGHPKRMSAAVPDENNLRRVTVPGGQHMISEIAIFDILDQNVAWLQGLDH